MVYISTMRGTRTLTSGRVVLALAAVVTSALVPGLANASRTGMPTLVINQTSNPAVGADPIRWVAALSGDGYGLGNNAACTGFFFDNDTVATAGHCVFNDFVPSDGRRWITDYGTLYVSRDAYWNGASAVKPYGMCTSVDRPSASADWQNTLNPIADYGAVRLNNNCTLPATWFAMSPQSPSSAADATYVTGYPGDMGLQIGNAFQMVKSTGQILGVYSDRLCYNVSTFGGNSGSPVYQSTSGGLRAFGIHNYGFNSMPGCGAGQNGGTRLSTTVINRLNSWRA